MPQATTKTHSARASHSHWIQLNHCRNSTSHQRRPDSSTFPSAQRTTSDYFHPLPRQEVPAVSSPSPRVLYKDLTPTFTVSCNACIQGLGGKPGSSAKFWDNANEIVQAALTAPPPCVQAYETQVCVDNCPSDPYGPTSGTFHRPSLPHSSAKPPMPDSIPKLQAYLRHGPRS